MLPPNQQLVATGKWPVVGEREPRDDGSPWNVSVRGLVGNELSFSREELHALPQVERVIDIHCVTRWSRPAMPFSGVLLKTLLDAADVADQAKFVSFVARSERKHSTSLPLEYLSTVEAMIALTSDGQPVPREHGGPIRMVVPGRYFYKSVKWLETIELLSEDRLGFWEADIGYHNNADPWQEERFIAGNISKQLATQLIEMRDFGGQDLLSIDCSNRDLDGLNAVGAALRNANFCGASLRNTNFENANLSGARMTGADLTGANFRGADVEGSDFSGATLKHADFSGASLFGASFCVFDDGPKQPAIFDEATKIDRESLDALTHDQRQFVLSELRIND